MFGISIQRCHLPDRLVDHNNLAERLTRRHQCDSEEIHFWELHRPAVLPVWFDGQLVIASWGNRDGNSRLPKTQWCRVESLQEGNWSWLHPQEAIIPATYCCDRGIWYLVHEGLKCVIVTMQKRQIAYPLSQPSTHYYEVMTRSARMPVFLVEAI